MYRSVKVSLGLATATKLRRVAALRREVRACIQRYINALWIVPGRLDAETLNRVLGGSLSYRHRSNCLKVALETVASTRKAAVTATRPPSCPHVSGAIRLSNLVAKIEKGKGAFDYVLRLAGLVPRARVVIPVRAHARLAYWLKQPGAKLLQGCTLGTSWVAFWIEIPDGADVTGRAIGVDIGVNKLFVDSDGIRYGTEIKTKCVRVRRCKPGSKGKLRARRARNQYIAHEAKRLPWNTIGVIGVENLTGLKTGKKKGRGKAFRKAIAPWTFREALTRIEQLAQEHRVRLVAVDPRGTSRTCPRCGTERKENRVGERFRCVVCNYSNDADHVGALNVLARTTGNSGQSMVAQSQES